MGSSLNFKSASKLFSRRHVAQKVRELSFRAFRRLVPNLRSLVFEDQAGNTVVANARDNFITFECVKYGGYKTSPIHQAILFYQKLGFPSGRTFLDVGANIGTETVSAIRSGVFDRAIAIEPDAANLTISE